MLLRQKNELEQQLNAAPLGSKERELIEAEYKAITAAVIEAEEEVYSTTESIGEIAASILENNLSKAQEALESLLTGGSSIDEMLDKMDRLSKSQEEYLTKTNQLYETNKLIRQAQQDMSETDSLLAKKKYQDYIKEVEALGEQNELSEYELEIAQAKYNLLQAEIALEDAKNAKDSMRLVRDASGNWNYVYTANQEKVDEAQQALEDAQNQLYNIGLEGAQDYQTKYAETMQEAVEAFQQINENYKDGMYASEEEYNAAMLAAQEYYYNQLKTYSDLYYIGHDLMVEESFQNEEDYIFAGVGNLEDFKNFTSEYLEECNSSFNDWKDNTHDVVDLVGEDLNDLDGKVDNVVDSSENLSDEVTSDLIPSLEDELTAVLNVTEAWALQREELYQVIDAYKELMSTISSNMYDTIGYSPTTNKGYNANIDYSSIMAAYLLNGGVIGDEIYNELKSQRDKKIEGEEEWNYLGPTKDESFMDQNSDWFQSAASTYGDEWEEILKDLLTSFDTGGYTGQWGSSGKLALLHEKELVLNANDTENLLSVIELIRGMSDFINNQIAINANSNNLSRIFGLNTPSTGENIVAQAVSIEATFPGVSSAREIEDALNNIINDAAQYASVRKIE